jgi:osmotically-inducible protein OsmY
MRTTVLAVFLTFSLGICQADQVLRGCVSQDKETGSFMVVPEQGERVRVSGALDLSDKVDRQVELTGEFKQNRTVFLADEARQISDECENPVALTAEDQGTSEEDVAATKQIRELVNEDDSLSIAAKNVKIITRNGMVTLRGRVESEQERLRIEANAREVVGSSRVENLITVEDAESRQQREDR